MAKEATLTLPALHCSSCANTIMRNLRALPSVEVARVDMELKQVHLQFEESAVTLDRIREALDEIGYSPDD